MVNTRFQRIWPIEVFIHHEKSLGAIANTINRAATFDARSAAMGLSGLSRLIKPAIQALIQPAAINEVIIDPEPALDAEIDKIPPKKPIHIPLGAFPPVNNAKHTTAAKRKSGRAIPIDNLTAKAD